MLSQPVTDNIGMLSHICRQACVLYRSQRPFRVEANTFVATNTAIQCNDSALGMMPMHLYVLVYPARRSGADVWHSAKD